MKNIVLMMVVVALSSCSQEQTETVKSPAPQVEEKEAATEVVEDASKQRNSETQIEMQTNKGMEVVKAEQPDVVVEPKKATPKQEVQVKGLAVAEQTTPVVSQEKVEPVVAPSKVVAPLTQGKGEIRSEPKNPPKPGLMLKTSSGDAIAGKKVAKKCMSCHTFNQGGKKKMGPNLFAIVGKAKGSDPKFRYGTYLKDIGGVWDENSLRAWIADSKGVAKAAGKKTTMASQKIKGKKADDLMAYLKSLK